MSSEKDKTNLYPCAAPFSQVYMVPRENLDMRFCSYHGPVYAEDQQEFYNQGIPALIDFFNTNEEFKRRRKAYLDRDFIDGAGCSPDCYWYCRWKTTGEGFAHEDFKTEDGDYSVRKIWLSVGPDCNIFCRYCLDPDKFHINYKTCDLQVMDLAREFIATEGSILLTGGEPFLPKFKLAAALESLAEEDSVTGEFEIRTNGMFLSPRNRDLILRGPVLSVNISMDTLREDLFEYLRKGASFENVWGNATHCWKKKEPWASSVPR